MNRKRRKLTLWHYRREVAELDDQLNNAWSRLEELYRRYPHEKPEHWGHPREWRKYWLKPRSQDK